MDKKTPCQMLALPVQRDQENAVQVVDVESDAQRTSRHLRMLGELADMGMELARRLGRVAASQPGNPGAVRAFTQMADSVRQTIALEARLEAAYRRRNAGQSVGIAGRHQRAHIRQTLTIDAAKPSEAQAAPQTQSASAGPAPWSDEPGPRSGTRTVHNKP